MPKEFLKVNNDKVVTDQDINLVDKAVESKLFYLSPDKENLEWGDVGLFCRKTNSQHPEEYCYFDYEAGFFDEKVKELVNEYNILKESTEKDDPHQFLIDEGYENLIGGVVLSLEQKSYKQLNQEKNIRKALEEFDHLTEYAELILNACYIEYEYIENN